MLLPCNAISQLGEIRREIKTEAKTCCGARSNKNDGGGNRRHMSRAASHFLRLRSSDIPYYTHFIVGVAAADDRLMLRDHARRYQRLAV